MIQDGLESIFCTQQHKSKNLKMFYHISISVCFILFLLHSLSGRRENIAPDYPLTLLEGLTTITHYCLLDNKKVKNAKISNINFPQTVDEKCS